MNISARWIRELVPGLELSPQQMADRLAMLGAPVDEVTDIGAALGDIVIGRVVSAQRHPNADRLNVCRVDAGLGHELNVVCGAPNVKAGAYYPFAPVGASLPGGVSIRKAKIRGEESQGMLCSARELGLGRDHEGILELHGDFEPGRSFTDAVGLDDARLLVDITPNRPDLLSHVGVARELAAAEGLRMSLHELPGERASDDLGLAAPARDEDTVTASGVTVRIEDRALCPQYIGVVIRNVRVGPSPEWLASRLRAIGLRPISNIVDATNYILHELGQPLHAFDLDRLGGHVVVRRAHSGERITTLDGVDRALGEGMLVIADASRPVAVAGVMGGADTEVHDDTRSILLECAIFDPKSVRTTRRALGLSTDASYRFERGVDPLGLRTAVTRAAALIASVAGGTVESAAAWAGRTVPPLSPLKLRLERVAQLLGERFTASQVAGYLEPLGFGVQEDGDVVHVTIPGHRRFDVSREEDLIEEIARRHGYDAFPDELRPFRPGTVPTHPLFLLEDRLRTLLVGRGFMEAHTAAFGPEADGDVALLLPLAATESALRRSLLPGLLRRVEYNFARGARSIRLFELGTVFRPGDEGGLPHEETRLAVVLTGMREPPHWSTATTPVDVWDIRALADELGAALGLDVRDGGGSTPLDAGLSFSLSAPDSEHVAGAAGRVQTGRVDAPAWADDVWALEVELRPEHAARRGIRVRPLPAFPAVERDLALLVPEGIPAAAVGAVIRGSAGSLLEGAQPFDVYAGQGMPEGVRSIAWRLRFRAPDRTLTDAEVDSAVRRVLERLEKEHGIVHRA